MRKLILIITTFLLTVGIASAQEAAVEEMGLTADEQRIIAQSMQVRRNLLTQAVAAETPEIQQLAEQTAQFTLDLSAAIIAASRIHGELQAVYDQMQAERAAGLSHVSAELEAEVRVVARQTLHLGDSISELVTEHIELVESLMTTRSASVVFEQTLLQIEAGIRMHETAISMSQAARGLASITELGY